VRLRHDDPQPVYRQIADEIRRRVLIGDLQPGELLPAVRALAADLEINPNTVQQAYRELESGGLVAGRRGHGTFVTLTPPAQLSEGVRRAVARFPSSRGLAAPSAVPSMSMPEPAAQAIRMSSSRARGTAPLLCHVDFELPLGAIGAVWGTALATVEAFVHAVIGHGADDATVTVLGGDPRENGVRARVGWVPATTCRLPSQLRLSTWISYVAARQPRWQQSAAAQLWERLGLKPGTTIGALAPGERRRLHLEIALLADPDLLIADRLLGGAEPGTGKALRRRLAEFAGLAGRTVLLIDDWREVEGLADHLTLLGRNRTLACGSVGQLTETIREYSCEVPEAWQLPSSGLEVLRVERSRKLARVVAIGMEPGIVSELVASGAMFLESTSLRAVELAGLLAGGEVAG
jgi:DNA-binding transcriptional regulator YhcF (GntR family)/ABC-type multidrug transport system ATPase subunit